MKILIFGGSGVISEYLTVQASHKYMNVYCYCRGNRKDLLPNDINIIYGDCFDKIDLDRNLKDQTFDVVIDFLSFNKGQLSDKLNSLKGKIKQYIFISSAVVYSVNGDFEKKDEGTDKNNFLWDYSKEKIECELLLQEYCIENNIKYTIVRPYITYGNQRIPFQINSFQNSFSLINRIILGKPIVIAGDGNNYCTLTHSEDFCKALLELFLNPLAYNNDFNIMSDETFTWNQVLDIIGETVGIRPNQIYLPVDFIENNSRLLRGSMVGDKARNMLFDNSKIKKILKNDNAFHIKFKDGIKNTVHYMMNTQRLLQTDSIWDMEMDHLIDNFIEKEKILDLNPYKTESTFNFNIDIYRSNYLTLEKKYYDMEKNYNWICKLALLNDKLTILESYFESNCINDIAIYGMGYLGKIFYELLRKSKQINIKYIIDMNVKEHDKLNIYKVGDNLEAVDAIIVTPITKFNVIQINLLKHYSYKIISLEEIL